MAGSHMSEMGTPARLLTQLVLGRPQHRKGQSGFGGWFLGWLIPLAHPFDWSNGGAVVNIPSRTQQPLQFASALRVRGVAGKDVSAAQCG